MERNTILLVDDNPQILAILADLLEPLGYVLLCAENGIDALALAASHHPDLVLLDVMMPEMDGFTVCQRLRATPDLAQIPVMMITALDDRVSRMRGFEAGADDFISKPFDYAELRARVATVIRLDRYRRIIEEQARVAAERARFAWVVEQADDGFLIIDAQDHVRYLNNRARQLLHLGPYEACGEPFLERAACHYRLVSPTAWEGWPLDADKPEPRFLLRPESTNGPEFWIGVDLLPPQTSGDEARVVRLRDVTTIVTAQRDMWSFHAMLTHKLRTPLVSIIGGLNILNDSIQTMQRDSAERIAQIALAGARRLQSEIEDVLHYLRSPADPYGNDACTIADLPELVRQSADDLAMPTVSTELGDTPPALTFGIARHSLEVIVHEILENARKFHPEQRPTVTVIAALSSPAQILIQFRDNGANLTPAQLANAWWPYYQGEKSFTGQLEGMGLGLALVARIVLAVGGRYSIGNRSDATGVCVSIELPMR